MKLDNLDLQPKYWIQLREQLEKIENKEILLDMLYEAVVDLTSNFSSGNLLYDIFNFQCAYGYPPEELISARQFAKFKGGSGLSKRIKDLGRLEVKKEYEEYAKRKVLNFET
tara:strand:+ start:2726 stop:3061 length:336 start_codon:yes stop_codon:yes gene_type:complete